MSFLFDKRSAGAKYLESGSAWEKGDKRKVTRERSDCSRQSDASPAIIHMPHHSYGRDNAWSVGSFKDVSGAYLAECRMAAPGAHWICKHSPANS